LQEELAIDVEVGAKLEEMIHAYPGRTVRLCFFKCELQRGQPQTLGCHALAWVTAAELDRYAFPAADARLLTRLRTEPELWV
jgi:mutator protein MutT